MQQQTAVLEGGKKVLVSLKNLFLYRYRSGRCAFQLSVIKM